MAILTTYNDNPPSDDGSQTDANKITWAKIKDELTDPLKDWAENVQADTIAEVTSGSGVTIDGVKLKDGYLSSATLPAFLATPAAQQTNMTGNGTTATVVMATEIFDQGADFISNTFTAPVTGRYLLIAGVNLTGATASTADQFDLILATSNRNYRLLDVFVNFGGTGWSKCISAVADMDAADTSTIDVKVTGEAGDVIDGDTISYFCGILLA